MQAKDLAKILKEHREKNNISQAQMAEKLNITQSNLSRIEAGIQLPRKVHIDRILEIVRATSDFTAPLVVDQKSKAELTFEEKFATYKYGWNYFSASRSFGVSGGDIMLVKELEKNSKLGVLIGDSVGHGNSSTYMSFAIEFSYLSMASIFNPSVFTPDLFDKAVSLGIAKTAKYWKGEPSMITMQADLEQSNISIINRGMPYPILISDESARPITKRRGAAYSLQKRDFISVVPVNEQLQFGQSIFLYTDGLLDLVEESELTARLSKLHKTFKGDSKAMGRNLIRSIKQSVTSKNVSDDLTFTIISRFRKGRNVAT